MARPDLDVTISRYSLDRADVAVGRPRARSCTRRRGARAVADQVRGGRRETPRRPHCCRTRRTTPFAGPCRRGPIHAWVAPGDGHEFDHGACVARCPRLGGRRCRGRRGRVGRTPVGGGEPRTRLLAAMGTRPRRSLCRDRRRSGCSCPRHRGCGGRRSARLGSHASTPSVPAWPAAATKTSAASHASRYDMIIPFE